MRQKFEHKVETLGRGITSIKETLRRYECEGWELVGISTDNSWHTMVFKRPYVPAVVFTGEKTYGEHRDPDRKTEYGPDHR